MTSVSRHRAGLRASLIRAGRALGNSSAMLTHACAERLGVTTTDWECVLLLNEALPRALTAGQLSDLTGLTTGAVTGVIDRLEAGGWVRRERDPVDRRRVIVRVIPERMAEAQPLYAGMLAEMVTLHDGFTDDQVAAVVEMLDRASVILRTHALEIRRAGRPPLPARAVMVDEPPASDASPG